MSSTPILDALPSLDRARIVDAADLAMRAETRLVNDAHAVAEAVLAALSEPSRAAAAPVRKERGVTHAHLRILFLLAENGRAATDTRLVRLYARKVARSGALSWPFISDAGLRTRRAELVRWGLVEFSGEWDRTVSNRATRVWQVSPGDRDFSQFRPMPSWQPETVDAWRRLLLEADDDLVVGAVLRWAARAAGVLS